MFVQTPTASAKKFSTFLSRIFLSKPQGLAYHQGGTPCISSRRSRAYMPLQFDDMQPFELMICSLTADDIQVASNLIKKASTYEKRTQVLARWNSLQLSYIVAESQPSIVVFVPELISKSLDKHKIQKRDAHGNFSK